MTHYRLKTYRFRTSAWIRLQSREKTTEPWRDTFDAPFRASEKRYAELLLKRRQVEAERSS